MKNIIKEWGLFSLFIILCFLSRLFIWLPVTVDGHSMDPTLADREKLIVIKTAKIDRFDMVVASEQDENGKTKRIVKRVIGIPGDTVTYQNDKLYINGQETEEPYLEQYLSQFKQDKLQSTYSYNNYFQELAKNSVAFTATNRGQTANFEITIPEGEYFLLGDDRIVSKDSREVGTFKKSNLIGEVKFRHWGGLDKRYNILDKRFWNFDKIGFLN